jgi:two-component system, OmpR family, phosphate regulon sensor histidine kinase PhoR
MSVGNATPLSVIGTAMVWALVISFAALCTLLAMTATPQGLELILAMATLPSGAAFPPIEGAPPQERASPPTTDERRQGAVDESWRSIIDALPQAALTLDADGVITHQNELIASLFPDMRVGKAMGQLLRNPDLKSALETASATSGPVVVHFNERVPVHRSIEATVVRLKLASDTACILVTFRDLTEREKIEIMRADFVANASHELRTPLASLKGYIETLQGPARHDEQARERFLGIMWSQAQRMSRLVDDLLSLTRVEMRAHLPPRGEVDLNEVTAYVVQALDPLADTHNAKIVLKNLDQPAWIRGDREEIVQALQNLVQNALKYGWDNGQIEVEVSRGNSAAGAVGTLKISVTDHGHGIEAHHLPRLVERFYRVNPASSREKGGTGLGLAIVKHIMLRHRGDLLIASEVGRGSTFTLSFEELRPQRR